MQRVIIKTDDNSETIFDESLQEIFHSKKGALSESNHVFIESGFNYLGNKCDELNIFEVGFGTGLNTILTLIQSDKLNKKVIYHSIEAYPLDFNLWNSLNYIDFLPKEYKESFYKLHSLDWNEEFKITDNFSFKKINFKLEEYFFNHNYNLIYFDAFSPDKQPILWTYDIFKKIYEALNNNSVLVTYCAKGDVKRSLQKAGFNIEKLKGALGKREMIRARKEIISETL
ncbi:MAG: tRNA (5-methylaminomethyl-2-thiouridine)(34)-methyltransferase MnmD [Candidatus Sericytochromatia bacterium]